MWFFNFSSIFYVDLYAGGIAETVSANANIATGPTFACLNMMQFANLKNGDMFYFENGPTASPNPFSLSKFKIRYTQLFKNMLTKFI